MTTEERELFAQAFASADNCDTCWYLCSDQTEISERVVIVRLRAHFASGHMTLADEAAKGEDVCVCCEEGEYGGDITQNEACMNCIHPLSAHHDEDVDELGPDAKCAHCVNKYADEIMRAIEHDITEGFEWGTKLPRDVGSFSALHDYCDANMYVLEAMGEVDTYIADVETSNHNALVNAIMDEVDKRLREMAAAIRASDDASSVFVVVTFPDSEARDAARISSVELHTTRPEHDSTQIVYPVKAAS